MPEYIELEAALNVCEMHHQHCLMMHDWCGDTTADNIKTDIETLPAADVVDVPYVLWLIDHFGSMLTWSKEDTLSEIKRMVIAEGRRNCVAKMDGKGDTE